MNQVLIKNIQLWSVVRTIFPAMWMVAAIITFIGYLIAGSIITSLASEFTDIPLVDPGSGVLAGIFISLFLGFLGTIMITLSAVIFVVIYNFLTSIGGGIAIDLAEQTDGREPEEGDRDAVGAGKS